MKKTLSFFCLALLILNACGGKEPSSTARTEQGSPPAELIAVWNNPEKLLSKAKKFHEKSEYDLAFSALKRIVDGFPKTEVYAEAKTLLKEVEDRLGIVSAKVGVLLPLTGQYSRFGEATLDGISCAFGLFDPCGSPPSRVQLVVRDTRGNAGLASQHARELVEQEKVVAIIGPLLSGEMESVSQTIAGLNIPLISLAPKRKTGNNPFIFQHSVFPDDEVRAIARKALSKGLNKFVLLYPKNSYGENYSKLFRQEISHSGGEILSALAYDPSLPEFSGILSQLIQKPSVNQALRGGHLGIFIPESYKQVINIGRAFDQLRVEGPRLIGTSRWHHNDLLRFPSKILEGAIIDTPFNPESGRNTTQNFVSAFRQAHNTTPAWLEAIGFDAGQVMIRAIESTGNNLPSDIRQSLSQINGFPAVVGSLSWNENGISQWPFDFITIRDGVFESL